MNISAVLLTVGEPSMERAAQSVLRQSRPALETIVVRNERPFSRALNKGALQVSSELFAQVDADMILDESCFEDLAGCVEPRVGVVLGQLRDPLLGRVVGVKLFRKECFERFDVPDTISPDTDFVRSIEQSGWRVVYALKPGANHTFGEHDPEYRPEYVFEKFFTLGQRFHYRGEGWASFYKKLSRSSHPASRLALAALAHGLVTPPGGTKGSSERFIEFLSASQTDAAASRFPLLETRAEVKSAAFADWCVRGAALRRESNLTEFLQHFNRIIELRPSMFPEALIGLSHGACAQELPADRLEESRMRLAELEIHRARQ